MKNRQVKIYWRGETLRCVLIEDDVPRQVVEGKEFQEIETAARRWIHGII